MCAYVHVCVCESVCVYVNLRTFLWVGWLLSILCDTSICLNLEYIRLCVCMRVCVEGYVCKCCSSQFCAVQVYISILNIYVCVCACVYVFEGVCVRVAPLDFVRYKYIFEFENIRVCACLCVYVFARVCVRV